jgi:pilus assembly protein CpaC
MRRIIDPKRLPWGSMIVILMAMAWPGLAPAQEPSPQPSALIVPINGTVRLQMSKKQKIKTVTNPKENAISIRTLAGDPTTILIIGQQPDVTRIELEDTDGNKETYEVIVQADVEYLRTQLRRAIPTANVTVIPTSPNTVILSGTVTRAEDVAVIRGLVQSVGFKYIDAVRVGGVQQVQLDVIIVQVNRTDLRALTFNFLTSSRNGYWGSTIGDATAFGGIPASAGTSSALSGTVGSATNLLGGFVHNTWGFQNVLEALRTNGLAKLLAEPRLVTLSGRPANFLVGGQQAIPQTGQFGGTGVTFAPFGTTLSFVPIVLGNGRIYLEVSPSVSSLDQAAGLTNFNGTNVPGRAINSVYTSVELESGQTFVISGLIQHTVSATVSRVPVVGDLPWLGTFFRTISYQDQEQEVLVIVTPWLVDAESCNQRPNMLPGEETRRPDDFELFLEGIIEAPRGPRQVCQRLHYVPPWMSSPSAALFPCASRGNCGAGGCGVGACSAGGCGVPAGNLLPAGPGPMAPVNSLASPANGMPAPLPAGATPVPLDPTSPPLAPTQAPPEAPLQPAPGKEANAPPAGMNDLSAAVPERGQR